MVKIDFKTNKIIQIITVWQWYIYIPYTFFPGSTTTMYFQEPTPNTDTHTQLYTLSTLDIF
jgi:hypothetical protein